MIDSDVRKIERILSFADDLRFAMESKSITREQVESDQFVQWALTTPLYNIGEYVSHVSRETKDAYPDIPWSKVAGLRHRLVHDYENTKWGIVAEVLFVDLWEFIAQLREVIPNDPCGQSDTEASPELPSSGEVI